MPQSQDPVSVQVDAFAALPDPAQANRVSDLVERLRRLKVWAGDPSYETIKERINAAWRAAGRPASELTNRSTVVNCFQAGRRRLNTDLVISIVEALHPDTGYVTQWRQSLRVIGGEIEAVSQVRVQDTLPQDLIGFTGRARELDRLRHATRTGGAVVISAIEGMAGVGKTQLAVHAGHLLQQQEPFDKVLFVNLRGFHPDPTQPPADPPAVLDGFLRLLGLPAQQIPHDLPARIAAYRKRLAGTRTLIVLDNAAAPGQVRPLLPATPGCLTLVTSRRRMTDLEPATELTVDVFTPDEAAAFLTYAVPEVPTGTDPDAVARIARRCGYLPLALSLITGHIRNTPGWTLTDHADRLDERRQQDRLDTGVELALGLSYRHLPPEQQRLFRLAALHPGQDFDAYAAAALTGTDLPTVQVRLRHVCRDHLLLQTSPDRCTFHDLARAFASGRAHDEDRPADRQAALTRLFDHYLAATADAMNVLYPAEAHLRPDVLPAGTPAPHLPDRKAALAWLDAERPNLIAVAVHTATHGWPGHTTRLAGLLSRYLLGGYYADALTVHRHAHHAARRSGDAVGQAQALRDLGVVHRFLGRLGLAADYCRQALDAFRRIGDPAGQARALYNLGIVAERSGHHPEAVAHLLQALELYRQAGDRTGEGNTLSTLGFTMERSGRFPEAIDFSRQALALARQTGNRHGEAYALNSLGDAEIGAGRYGPGGDRLKYSLALSQQLGYRSGESTALDSLGMLHTRLGRFDQAVEFHHRALAIAREIGSPENETWALNGLGEAACAAGRPAEALTHHVAALAIAADTGNRREQARAHSGLGRAHQAAGHPVPAREHHEPALPYYTDLGLPRAEQIRALCIALQSTREHH